MGEQRSSSGPMPLNSREHKETGTGRDSSTAAHGFPGDRGIGIIIGGGAVVKASGDFSFTQSRGIKQHTGGSAVIGGKAGEIGSRAFLGIAGPGAGRKRPDQEFAGNDRWFVFSRGNDRLWDL